MITVIFKAACVGKIDGHTFASSESEGHSDYYLEFRVCSSRKSQRSVDDGTIIYRCYLFTAVQRPRCSRALALISPPLPHNPMSTPIPPTRDALLHLYSLMLRSSRTFSSYNFRQYFVARTKSTFKEIQNESDPAKLSEFYNNTVKELAILRRSSIVNQLYGGMKLVVEQDKSGQKLGGNN